MTTIFVFAFLIASIQAATQSCTQCYNETFLLDHSRREQKQCVNRICYTTTCNVERAMGRPIHGGHRAHFVDCDNFNATLNILRHDCYTSKRHEGLTICKLVNRTSMQHDDDDHDNMVFFMYTAVVSAVLLMFTLLWCACLTAPKTKQKTKKV